MVGVVGIMHGDVLHEHDAARVSMMAGGTNVPLLQRWLLLHVAVSCCMWHVARAVMLHGVGAAGELPKRSRKQGLNCKLSKKTALFPFSDSTMASEGGLRHLDPRESMACCARACRGSADKSWMLEVLGRILRSRRVQQSEPLDSLSRC
jgi:hypothetical protein